MKINITISQFIFSHQLKFDINNPIIIPKGRENKTEIRSLQEAFQAQFGQIVSKVILTIDYNNILNTGHRSIIIIIIF